MKLRIKVVPRSSRDCIEGWLDGTLKVRVRAPAEHGRANAAVERVVADALGVPKKRASIVAGKTSTRKIMEIDGLREAEVYGKLSKVTIVGK